MIAAGTSSAPPSPWTNGRIGPGLEELHRAWLRDLRTRAERAKAKDRNIWARWEAIQYVDSVLSDELDRERSAVGGIAEGPVLWVAGELVASLRWQLRNSVGLCHHGAEFSALMGKLVRAVEHWFTTVENVVGPTRWADLSPEARREFASLGIEAPMWNPSPAAVTTTR